MQFGRLFAAAALVLAACGGGATLETNPGGGGTGGSGGSDPIPQECEDPSKWVDPPFTATFDTDNWLWADQTAVQGCKQYLLATCAFAPICSPVMSAQLVCHADGSVNITFYCPSVVKDEGHDVKDAAFNNLSVGGLKCSMEVIAALPGDDPCAD